VKIIRRVDDDGEIAGRQNPVQPESQFGATDATCERNDHRNMSISLLRIRAAALLSSSA